MAARMREGYVLVQVCRLPSGGGTVKPGAMPFTCVAIGRFFPVLAKALAIKDGLLPPDTRIKRFLKSFNLEEGLYASAFATIIGMVLLAAAVSRWRFADFGT